MPKSEYDTESQKQRKRKPTIEDNEPENRGVRRRLSLSDFPISIGNGDGSQLSKIQIRPSQHICHSIQQLRGAAKGGDGVPILLSLIDEFNTYG